MGFLHKEYIQWKKFVEPAVLSQLVVCETCLVTSQLQVAFLQ